MTVTISKATGYALFAAPPLAISKATAYVAFFPTPPVAPQTEQMVMLGVEDVGGSTPQLSELVMLAVIDAPPFSYSLGPAIKLPCWQPCTAFGTHSKIVIFK